ncbi:MAG: FAD-dependent oxidoreductase, partial [Muribaculaceae bacterium]|nr:FAD-dependent oxidoreductase [Muribaculaceae bacterium]
MDRRNFIKRAGMASLLLGAGGVAQAVEIAETASQSANGQLTEKKRRIPITRKADVVVCGGGPAGIGAAIEAARSGAKTVLIEHAGFLGGTWTAGLLGVMLDHEDRNGLMGELKQTLTDRRWRNTAVWTDELFTFDVERMKLLLDEMCAEAGVDLLLYTTVTDAVVNKGRITHVVTESKSGREAIEGKIFVDATGDGDLAAMSGCGYDVGNEEGHMQPMSMLGLVTGVNFEDIKDCVLWDGKKTRRTSKRALIAEIRRGGHEGSYKMPCLFLLHDNLYALMANHQYGMKGFDRDHLTKASIEGRREVHRIVDSLQGLGGRWEGLKLVATASQIGCREGRRIHGLYTVTADDLVSGRKHEDAACQVRFGVDVHSVHVDNEGKGKSYTQGIKSKPYDIPMRALIAKDVKGLMMTGRCI